jgi:hypothetical protein
MQDAAVLGDDAVDETQVAGDPAELVENPAGHEQDLDAARPDDGDRVAHVGPDDVVARDGAVVVECQYEELHEMSTPDAKRNRRALTGLADRRQQRR